MMPRQIVLCRHGQGENNFVWNVAKSGDSALLEELMERPPEKAPLTETGVKQIELLGEWLRKEQFIFKRKYHSPLRRARQSAKALKLPGKWIQNANLREQSLGIMRYVTPEQREEYLASLRGSPHLRNPYTFAPVGGESFADVATKRIVPFLQELEDECNGEESVLIMGHSGTNKMLDCCIRQWSPREFVAHYVHGDNKIFNGMALHYTRINPETGEESDTFDWVRSCCPWVDLEPSPWQKIERGPRGFARLSSYLRELLALPAA